MTIEPPVSRNCPGRQQAQAALEHDPLVGHVAGHEQHRQQQVLPHLQPAQHGPGADQQAGGGELGQQQPVDVRWPPSPEQCRLLSSRKYSGTADADQQVGGRQGRTAVLLDEDHQEAEAHQQHRHHVDGPLVLLDLLQRPAGAAMTSATAEEAMFVSATTEPASVPSRTQAAIRKTHVFIINCPYTN